MLTEKMKCLYREKIMNYLISKNGKVTINKVSELIKVLDLPVENKNDTMDFLGKYIRKSGILDNITWWKSKYRQYNLSYKDETKVGNL